MAVLTQQQQQQTAAPLLTNTFKSLSYIHTAKAQILLYQSKV